MGPEITRRLVSSNAICTPPDALGWMERTVAKLWSAGETSPASLAAGLVINVVTRAAKKPIASSAIAPTGWRYWTQPEKLCDSAFRKRRQGLVEALSDTPAPP